MQGQILQVVCHERKHETCYANDCSEQLLNPPQLSLSSSFMKSSTQDMALLGSNQSGVESLKAVGTWFLSHVPFLFYPGL